MEHTLAFYRLMDMREELKATYPVLEANVEGLRQQSSRARDMLQDAKDQVNSLTHQLQQECSLAYGCHDYDQNYICNRCAYKDTSIATKRRRWEEFLDGELVRIRQLCDAINNQNEDRWQRSEYSVDLIYKVQTLQRGCERIFESHDYEHGNNCVLCINCGKISRD